MLGKSYLLSCWGNLIFYHNSPSPLEERGPPLHRAPASSSAKLPRPCRSRLPPFSSLRRHFPLSSLSRRLFLRPPASKQPPPLVAMILRSWADLHRSSSPTDRRRRASSRRSAPPSSFGGCSLPSAIFLTGRLQASRASASSPPCHSQQPLLLMSVSSLTLQLHRLPLYAPNAHFSSAHLCTEPRISRLTLSIHRTLLLPSFCFKPWHLCLVDRHSLLHRRCSQICSRQSSAPPSSHRVLSEPLPFLAVRRR
ncbi:unnamed protein product [Musa acuminata subsp. burmannicoides]